LRPLTPWHAAFLWAARHTDASYIPNAGPWGYVARGIPHGLLVIFWELYDVIGAQWVRAKPFESFQYYRPHESTNLVLRKIKTWRRLYIVDLTHNTWFIYIL
jgi:hypothetical protein